MANRKILEALRLAERNMKLVDMESLIREDHGTASLEKPLRPLLNQLDSVRDLFLKFAPSVSNSSVQEAIDLLGRIAILLKAHAAHGRSMWISNREDFLRELEDEIDKSLTLKFEFVAAGIVDQGLLNPEGVKEEYSKTVADLKKESAEIITQVRTEAGRIVSEAEKLASDIEARARKTATKISVKEAQDQFKASQFHLDAQIKKWGRLAVLVAIGFLIVIGCFYYLPISEKDNNLAFASKAILRVFGLSVLAAVFSFSFRMLRAYLHMSELNLHRQRVANSMEAFVQAAGTDARRDVILSNLVEAVVNFGNSGILANDNDTLAGQKVGVQSASSFLQRGISGS